MSAEVTGPGPPAVSVVVIFKDEERFLAEAVESVLAQTVDDWELLLVDDGSTDASTGIARRYADRLPDRIRYLEHPGHANRGMSASRNRGIALARGRWLTFLDGDDVWLPHKLEAQLGSLERHREIQILVSPAQWWRSGPHGAPDDVDWVQSLGPGLGHDTVVEPPGLLTDFLEDEWRSICDVLIAREAAVAVGGYEEEFRGMFEDQVFHAKVLSRYPALVTAAWWYRYRQHLDACTADNHRRGTHPEARRRYLDWLAAHLGAVGGSADLRRAVLAHRRRARHPYLTRITQRIGSLVS